jgi:hypothetical protein
MKDSSQVDHFAISYSETIDWCMIYVISDGELYMCDMSCINVHAVCRYTMGHVYDTVQYKHVLRHQ